MGGEEWRGGGGREMAGWCRSWACVGGEGEGEVAHDGGLDPALKVEELTRCHRARGAGRDEAGSARDIHGAHKVANGSGANAAKGGDDEWDEVTFEEVAACRVFGYLIRRASAVKTCG